MPPLLQGKTYVLLEFDVELGRQHLVNAVQLPDMVGEAVVDDTVSGDWSLGRGWSPVVAAAVAIEEMLR